VLGRIRHLQQRVDVRYELRRMGSVSGVADEFSETHRCMNRLKHFLVFLRRAI